MQINSNTASPGQKIARAIGLLLVGGVLLGGTHAVAQVFPPNFGSRPFPSRPGTQLGGSNGAESFASPGTPFGVFSVDVPLPASWNRGTPRLLVNSTLGNTYYPAFELVTVEVQEAAPQPVPRIGRPGGIIDRVRNLVQGQPKTRQQPVAVRVMGLFTGNEPLVVDISGDITQSFRIPLTRSDRGPRDNVGGNSDSAHRQLLDRWWTNYVANATEANAGEDTPALVHRYLTTMLADRLQLPRVDLDPPSEEEEKQLAEPLETLELLAAIEPLREEILEEVIAGIPANDTSEQPVPPAPIWQTDMPAVPGSGLVVPAPNAVEKLASRVPPECFYLRFGSFSNYVWFQELAERFGGDISNAVVLRGFDYEASQRMERMLASKLTTIAKMFGDKLVGDMAIVGSDLYMREGASLGVLFYATNPGLLATSMESDRKSVLSKNSDAELADVSIAGQSVSLLATPDGRIRSFFSKSGPFIFISSSEHLTQRFLEISGGAPSMAADPGFQNARAWMPDSNDYSVFAYFSPAFFRNLVSPQYQIELRRRLEAVAHLELAEVATQAALAEGLETESIQQLQQAGFLPNSFDLRADGARVLRSDGAWVDSIRGARGSFRPIADVAVQSVSQLEAERYGKLAEYYTRQWQRMDPMMIGLRRFQLPNTSAEQVTLEAYVAPFEAKKYGWIAQQLAEPTPIEIQLPADDAASVQLHVRGSIVPDPRSNYHLFAGVKDMRPPEPEDTKGLIRTLQALRAAPAYLGAWPKPGLIEQLPLGLGLALANPDYAGFSRMLGGLWRWQNPEFSLLSFNRQILDQAIPQLGVRQATDYAQARVRVAGLENSQLAEWINTQWYRRGWRASQGNARLLDAVHQQLKVPPADCLEATQRLLDVKLQCPLGGQYTLRKLPGGKSGWWESSAWSAGYVDERGKQMPPPTYSAPWIKWFQGGQIHVTQRPSSLAAVGSFDLQLPPRPTNLTPDEPSVLPPMNFDLFNLPFKLFGGEDKKAKKPERRSF